MATSSNMTSATTKQVDFSKFGITGVINSTMDKNLDAIFEKLSFKQKEWCVLPPHKKLAYIEDAIHKLSESIEIVNAASEAWAGPKLKCLTDAEEKELCIVNESILFISVSKSCLDSLRQYYEVLCCSDYDESSKAGKIDKKHAAITKQLKGYKVETLNDGQVIANVFPLTTKDKLSPTSNNIGQLYLDKGIIRRQDDVQSFIIPGENKKGNVNGVGVILGAGNIPALTINDTINTLFYNNQVCFLKQHPIRNELEYVTRFIFSKLYEDGYLYSEMDSFDITRSSKILYHPCVASIHMTGGKRTHDIIVWGATDDEQKERKENRNPKLQSHVTMTSELGSITPYIISPYECYKKNQLQHQANVIVSAKLFNGGAACNSPQVVLLSQSWTHRNTFVQYIINYIKSVHTPNAFYPGSEERYKQFKSAYPTNSRAINGLGGTTINNYSSGGPVHLPVLLVEIEVDITSPEGLERAKNEYAFRNEAFGPVLVIATVKSDNGSTTLEDFMSQAVTICNECMFGTLSASLMVPDSEQKLGTSIIIENTLQNLKYGTIVTNAWSAAGFNPRLVWGGYQGTENIYDLESGIGYVNNSLQIQNVEKAVLRTPINDSFGHITIGNKSRAELIRTYRAATYFLVKPSICNALNLVGSVIPRPW